ncbi:hypothetical protein [Halomonas sp. DN3]|uniref:hypothetical protein n=1 Tax=Halomonas sp. DN3 TaxID=2953657 RepID=UPI00209DD646|nr:hypothetical protein [Halomonas sp. DN3]USZ51104.1 hypothetical protein NKF27_06290 [Halomonas sp. DN3]
MTFKPTLAALLITAMPVAVQAGQASALSMQFSEPLSAVQQGTAQSVSGKETLRALAGALEHADQSAAMADSRARLNAMYRAGDGHGGKSTNAGLLLARNATK